MKKYGQFHINCFKSENSIKSDQKMKLDTRKNNKLWGDVKAYFKLDTDKSCDTEDIKFKDLRQYLDDYCYDNSLLKHNGWMMQPSDKSPISYEPIGKFSEFLDNIFREHKYKEAYKGICTKG